MNVLRNVAVYYAPTTYVFACDVDFIPMPGTYERLLQIVEKDDSTMRRVGKWTVTRMTFNVIPLTKGHLCGALIMYLMSALLSLEQTV